MNLFLALLQECEFERMQHCEPNNISGINNYAAFVTWNVSCISELQAVFTLIRKRSL